MFILIYFVITTKILDVIL